jgi:beta-galactosidase
MITKLPLWLSVSAIALSLAGPAWSQAFTPPASPHAEYNFDIGWKFFKEDRQKIADGQTPAFNDSGWQTVSTPHTFNDVDTYRVFISHGGGDRGGWKGTAWYRKHFELPASSRGNRVFLEFEGMRQAGEIFLNGKAVGLYENGVTPYGVDITDAVNFSGDNVLAVHVDNSGNYQERSSGTNFQWNANDFNPNHGGINRHVRLHVMSPIHQTLPLYYGLKTSGIYIYPENIDLAARSADITIESQVKNGSSERATVLLSAYVVDADGNVQAKFAGDALDMVAGERSVITATGNLKNARFWSPESPALYDVYTTLTVDGNVVDVRKTTTGFRKAEFKGGAGTGGVYINDKFYYLKGYAQRSANDWAGLGGAYPDWMHDLTSKLIRDGHGNYVRWMHVAPQPADVASCDRFGIIQVVPGGDKERDVTGRQWEQRMDVMEATIIAHRNSPSNLFWEIGNTVVTLDHTKQMVDLRKKWDPHGMRVIGARGNSDNAANLATTNVAEFYGVMIGQDRQTESIDGPNEMFRGFSIARRDHAPIIETEDFRDEGARRFWDDFSPPYYGFKKGPDDSYQWNSETFALASAGRYYDYWINRISNPDPAHSRWSGYCSIYFSDSNADGRQQNSEVCRVSGKVDSMRLPKQIYYAHRVMQNESPDLHILGHWTYPATQPGGAPTKKTIYVIANTESVELSLNGKVIGSSSTPVNIRFGAGDSLGKVTGSTPAPGGFVFQFPDVAWQPGKLTAVGKNKGRQVAQHELETAGAPARIRLTPITNPNGGFRADGADVALVDVEVVDAQGRRCPTDDARVDFTCSGPAIWRGGYNSGKLATTNNLYLNTECGINRIAVRATTTPGKITITAKRDGLASAAVELETKPVEVVKGLAKL